MALYELSVATNAQQAEGSASTATIETEQQVIREALIFIDPSSNGEVLAQLRFGDSVVFPHPNAGTVSAPGRNGPTPIKTQLPGVPTDIQLRAWAPNADFSHEVIAQFEAVPPDEIADPVRIIGGGGGGEATARPARGTAEELTGTDTEE